MLDSCRAPQAAPIPLPLSHSDGSQLPFNFSLSSLVAHFFQLPPSTSIPQPGIRTFHLHGPRSAFNCICTSLSAGLPLQTSFDVERRPFFAAKILPVDSKAKPDSIALPPSFLPDCLRPVLPGSLAQLQNLSSTHSHPTSPTRSSPWRLPQWITRTLEEIVSRVSFSCFAFFLFGPAATRCATLRHPRAADFIPGTQY